MRLPYLFALLLSSSVALAQQQESTPGDAGTTPQTADREARGLSVRRSRTGFTDSKPAFGGPTSPEGQLEVADREKDPAFRFPKIDAAFEPWTSWKTRQNEDHGLQLSAHYSTMYQALSDAVPGGDDVGSGGVLRATMKWTPVGRDTPDTGSLVVTLDHRHAYRDTDPAGLAGQAGYIGVTGLFYNDIKFAVINLNWQQAFNDGRTGLIAGRYDPNDYMNALGYVNPWRIFSNLSINLDTSVALPDSSWGVGVGHWLTDQVYVIGGLNDANGAGADDLEFFDGGAEFFKYAHVGWSPSRSERYFKNVHALAWHVDKRDDAGVPSAHGFALAANWTFDDRWMPFARLGWSSGAAPIYNRSASLGLIRKFSYRSDLVGMAVNWGSPPGNSLSDQTTIETFWRFQFSQNFEITPSLQLLLDPAQNPVDDQVWVYGLRTRLAF